MFVVERAIVAYEKMAIARALLPTKSRTNKRIVGNIEADEAGRADATTAMLGDIPCSDLSSIVNCVNNLRMAKNAFLKRRVFSLRASNLVDHATALIVATDDAAATLSRRKQATGAL